MSVTKTNEEKFFDDIHSLPEEVMKYIPNEGQIEGNNYQKAFYKAFDLNQLYAVIKRFLYDKYGPDKVFKDFYDQCGFLARLFDDLLDANGEDIMSFDIFSEKDNLFLEFFNIVEQEGNGPDYLDRSLISKINDWWVDDLIDENDIRTYSPKLRKRIEFVLD